jgi:predicted transcriptional regulator
MSVESQELTPQQTLSVALRYGELKVEFSGTPEDVGRSINSFLAREIPAYSLASRLALKFGAGELVESFAEYVRISPEGPVVLLGEKKLSDRQLVSLRLVAQEIAFETGSATSNYLSLSELQSSIGLNAKTLSSRLSELSKLGHAARETRNGSTNFKITTLGINALLENLSKKDRKS